MADDKNRETIMRVIELRRKLISSLVKKKADRPATEFEKSKLINQQADRIRANDRLRGLFAEYNRLRSELVENNLPLVHKYTLIYHRRTGLPYDDLVQCGMMGLVLGIDKYDGRENVRLTSYATWWIRQRLQEYTRAELDGKYDVKIINLSYLDETNGDREDRTPTCEPYQDELAIRAEEVEKFLSTLDSKSRMIVEMKFGLNGHPAMTQREIGREIGLTGSRIQQIVARAIKVMRRDGAQAEVQTIAQVI